MPNIDIINKKVHDLEVVLKNFSTLSFQQQNQLEGKVEKISGRFLHYIVLKKEVSEKLERVHSKLGLMESKVYERVSKIMTQVN